MQENQYKSISQCYQAFRQDPVTRYLELPSVLQTVGSPQGRRLLDLACGSGFYTRILRSAGAIAATGIDLSPEMIALAIEEEQQNPLGIDYRVGNAVNLEKVGEFDLVTAIFLLNYARDEKTLAAMTASMAQQLCDGGQLVTVLPNPDFQNGRGDLEAYGFTLVETGRAQEAIHVKMTFHSHTPFSIEFTQWSYQAIEMALMSAGFNQIEWIPFTVSAEGVESLGQTYWDALLQNPKSTLLRAFKKVALNQD